MGKSLVSCFLRHSVDVSCNFYRATHAHAAYKLCLLFVCGMLKLYRNGREPVIDGELPQKKTNI